MEAVYFATSYRNLWDAIKITDRINVMGSVTDSLLPTSGSGWSTPFWCKADKDLWASAITRQRRFKTLGLTERRTSFSAKILSIASWNSPTRRPPKRRSSLLSGLPPDEKTALRFTPVEFSMRFTKCNYSVRNLMNTGHSRVKLRNVLLCNLINRLLGC